jgi:hypothetical protein
MQLARDNCIRIINLRLERRIASIGPDFFYSYNFYFQNCNSLSY